MVFLHDLFRLVLPLVVDYAHHVLSYLYLSLVGLEVDVDGVISADSVTVENFHAPWRHFETFGQNEILRCWQKQLAIVGHHLVGLLRG